MELPRPESLTDLITDGVIAQADVDVAVHTRFGIITGVEFTSDNTIDTTLGEVPVEVRLHRRSGSPMPVRGRMVAEIRDGIWIWLTPRAGVFDIPELHGPQQASDELLRAARTLYNNAPVFLAPSAAVTRVVVLEVELPLGPVREGLIQGLAQLDDRLDVTRALLAFAASRGLGVHHDGHVMRFSEGTVLTMNKGRVSEISGGLSLSDVRADARFFSYEHQLFFAGLYPRPDTRLDIGRGMALLNAEVEANAFIIATLTEDTWTWAWADSHLPPSAAINLRRFGLDHGIPQLFQPRLSRDEALRLNLEDVAKAILGVWTHTFIPLNKSTFAVVLLDAPSLRLPSPTDAATTATLQAPLAPELDQARAEQAYRQRRGIS